MVFIVLVRTCTEQPTYIKGHIKSLCKSLEEYYINLVNLGGFCSNGVLWVHKTSNTWHSNWQVGLGSTVNFTTVYGPLSPHYSTVLHLVNGY